MVVLLEVVDGFLQVWRAPGLSQEKWMQRNSHNAGGFPAVSIESVELVGQGPEVLLTGIALAVDQAHIVDIHSIRHGEELSLLHFHCEWLIVAIPVTHVYNAFCGKQIEGIEGFRKSRTEPAGGFLSGCFFDGPQARLNRPLFFFERKTVQVPAI